MVHHDVSTPVCLLTAQTSNESPHSFQGATIETPPVTEPKMLQTRNICRLQLLLLLLMMKMKIHRCQSEDVKTVAEKEGKTVVFSPEPVSDPSVRWIYEGIFAAELVGSETNCSEKFKGRCHIDPVTGNLTISNLTVRDSGIYGVKFNGVVTDVTKLKVISSVPKPRISSECNSINCTLTCEVNITEDMKPVEFFWKINGNQRPGTKELIITKETGRDFSCTLKNNVSSEDSSDMKNPLETGSPTLIIIISITAAVLLVLLVAYCSKHRESAELPPKEKSLTERNQNGLLKESRGKWWT
uniref:Ig-like domain-containing protein n=1 Tax=Oryzias melastigma TaxID=30732 RepID=A0A3B3BUM4_ORYME